MPYAVQPIPRDEDGRVCRHVFSWVLDWWQARGSQSPKREMLPGCGVIAQYNQQPLAAGWLYLDATGSGMGWLAWLVSNPDAPPLRAGRALRLVMEFLAEHAQSLGYHTLVSTYQQPSLVRLCQRLGFHAGDRGLTHLFKPLI